MKNNLDFREGCECNFKYEQNRLENWREKGFYISYTLGCGLAWAASKFNTTL